MDAHTGMSVFILAGIAGMGGCVLVWAVVALFAGRRLQRSYELHSKGSADSPSMTSGQSPNELNYVETKILLAEVMRRFDASVFIGQRLAEKNRSEASYEASWTGNHAVCSGLCTYGSDKIWEFFTKNARDEKV